MKQNNELERHGNRFFKIPEFELFRETTVEPENYKSFNRVQCKAYNAAGIQIGETECYEGKGILEWLKLLAGQVWFSELKAGLAYFHLESELNSIFDLQENLYNLAKAHAFYFKNWIYFYSLK